jgi:hypothetical protein
MTPPNVHSSSVTESKDVEVSETEQIIQTLIFKITSDFKEVTNTHLNELKKIIDNRAFNKETF